MTGQREPSVQEPSAETGELISIADFRTIFESAPSLCLILDPQFRIVGASESHMRATMTVRAEIMGRDVFDVFPDNPDDPDATGVTNLRASLHRVRQHSVADTMAIQKYEVGNPAEPGGFESRYWSICNSPVLGADRQLIYILVSTVITDALNLSRPLADAGGVRLSARPRLPADLCVAADYKRLRQVLLNLLSNAIKYNHPTGTVGVTVGHPADQRLRISVTDTGRGIPPNALGKLFTPFERLDAAQAGIAGTGLGLALSRQLMHAMHGTLEVSSLLGQGSTFWLDLPTSEPVTTTQPPAQTDNLAPRHRDPGAGDGDGDGDEKRVLYVEDMVENMRLVERILTRRPTVTLIPAMLGAIAQDLARDHHPHLILLDLHLPDITGEEVMRRLQADSTTSSIPILVLSADATQGHIDRLLATGATAYITKPFAFGDFLHTIDDLLNNPSSPQPSPHLAPTFGAGAPELRDTTPHRARP